jgi:hypothetical protein
MLYYGKFYVCTFGNLRSALIAGTTADGCILKTTFLKSCRFGNEINGMIIVNIEGRKKKYFHSRSPKIGDGEKA